MDQTDMHMSHVGDLLDAYALGALELDEVDRIERHLQICAGCRSMLEPSRQTAEELLIAVPPVAVPSSLRARTLERIRAEKMADRTLPTQPGYVIWPVEGTADAPSASARLVIVAMRPDAVLLASGLRVLETGQVYQVWFLGGGQALASALFTVDMQGQGSSMLRLPAPLATFDSIAVTVEPRDGSPSPTGPIVLAGPIGY
jgi:anti-sigma-K factor RskA